MIACRALLGTYVEIRVEDSGLADAAQVAAVNAAFAAMEQVQELMSVHSAESDISRINLGAHRAAVEVHPWTRQVLRLALEVHRLSGGLFECSVARRLADWGLLPGDVLARTAADSGSMASLELFVDGRVAARAPVDIDLGGIAKGFAVDQAAEVLQRAGIAAAVINAGGDLRVLGTVEQPIHVRDPNDPSRLHLLGLLQDGAVATSGSYFSSAAANRPDRGALVDPRSGNAVVAPRSYSVIAPSCMLADALTKVLAVSGDATHPCFAHFGAQAVII